MPTFVQIADLHLDTPFSGCGVTERTDRRKELREAFAFAVRYCREHKTELLLICGDLFDGECTSHDTVEYVANCLSQIPETKVFITPGNHDPYNDASPYRYCSFSGNVHIFTSETLEVVELPTLGCAVYGFGYRTSKLREDPICGITPRNLGRINILMGHGDVDVHNSPYYNIQSCHLEKSNLDYVALGHIHKPSGLIYCQKTPYAYSGCLAGRDFSESGMRGMIAGTIEKGKAEIRYIPVTDAVYEEITIDVTGMEYSDIISEASKRCGSISKNARVRIVLEGERSDSLFIYDERMFEGHIPEFRLFKVLDRTAEKLYISELMQEYSLRGLYAKQLKPYLESQDKDVRERAMFALRLGLEALKK